MIIAPLLSYRSVIWSMHIVRTLVQKEPIQKRKQKTHNIGCSSFLLFKPRISTLPLAFKYRETLPHSLSHLVFFLCFFSFVIFPASMLPNFVDLIYSSCICCEPAETCKIINLQAYQAVQQIFLQMSHCCMSINLFSVYSTEIADQSVRKNIC